MISKEKVRRKALEVRDNLGEDWREKNSDVIVEKVLGLEQYKKAKIILSYCAFRSEVETKTLNQRVIGQGKKLYLPKTYSKEKKLCFYPVDNLKKLRRGYEGIYEPEETVPVEELFANGSEYGREDVLMIMPGVAFDENGYRMGYGGGYYDRYLQQYGDKLTSVLIAFEEQKSLIIPAEKCDIKPDYIVTQKEDLI